MNHADGWMGGLAGGGMWDWTVVGLPVVVLPVVVIIARNLSPVRSAFRIQASINRAAFSLHLTFSKIVRNSDRAHIERTRKCHKLSLQLKKLVSSYQSGYEQAATGFRQTIKNYVELLERHIVKENNVLFPMAETKSEANRDNALFAAFERHERERIGVGKHEAFDSLPGKLQGAYIKK
jgi:hypothetical protein